MNNILSITVDSAIEYGTRAKRCVATCTKVCTNGQNLGLNIINV